jgi:asparagine synthase (glutamine-hydrolysing)
MSGIAGVYSLDGRSVDPALLQRMTDVIAHRGPDGCDHWLDGPVGLGHRMLYSTPESLHEKQPAVDETGGLVITADARIDNRGELITTLCVNGKAKEEITDVELCLKAYEKWGEQCGQRIIGDFAFAIWDERNRQLFCARDPLGIRPFYYYMDGHRFIFGSELHQLFVDHAVRREPNDGMIGEYLACAITNQEETLYRGVLRLPPGHFLIVRPGQLRRARHWDIDPSFSIRHQSDSDYTEHFLEIFTEAVRCRLRSHRPVGAYLSGGLDSSSIVGITQSLYREGAPANPGFETFSILFPGLPCDESSYIQEVLRMWGIKGNTICSEETGASCYAEHVRRYQDFPNYPNDAMFDPIRILAREKGFQVLLTGLGGDEWLTGSLYHYADLLRRFRILSLIRQICFDSQVPEINQLRFRVLKLGLWPLVPQGVRRVLRAVLRRDGVPPWINPQFARRIGLTERLRQKAVGRQFQSFAQADLYKLLTSGEHIHSLETEERSASWFGLEERHPFNDRRIVEFALALPEEQRWRQDQPKYLLRQAMQRFLPKAVQQRRTKAEFSHTAAKAFQALGGQSLFDSLAVNSMGWADGAWVRKRYREMAQLYAQSDEGYITHVWPLWMIFGIELWFKTVFLDKEIFSSDGLWIQAATAQPV